MPRSQRIQDAETIYHLTTRGNRSGDIVYDDCDCETFMAITGDVFARFELECIAYCLMTTHYHHLAETRDENLSAAMERLNGLYARSFNRRHGLRGHVFERRFSSKLVTDEDYLFGCCRYIALNPVKAGLCALPEQWPWSFYPVVLGLAPAPSFFDPARLLARLGDDAESARAALREFVEEGLAALVA
jgi:putative transposase